MEDKKLFSDKKSFNKRSSWYLYVTAIIANLFIFSVGSVFSWNSSASEILKSNDSSVNPLGAPITAVQESWIGSLLSLGAAIGPPLAGKVSDTLGRKRTLLIISIPNGICFIALAYAKHIAIFYICRLIMGLVAGTVYAVTSSYLTEISEVHNRGAVSAMLCFFSNSGVLFSFLVGPLCSLKVLTFLCAIPFFSFVLLSSIFIPESPVFLVSVGRKKKVVKVLQQLRRTHDVEQDLLEITKTFESTRSDGNSITKIITDKSLRKALLISTGLMYTCQFTGVNPIVCYLEAILKAFGSSIPLYLSVSVVGVLQVVANLISIAAVDKVGRRMLILISTAGVLTSQITLSVYFFIKEVQHRNLVQISWLPVALIYLFIFSIGLGLANLPYTVTAEVYPNSFKAVGTSLGASSCFIFSFIVTFSFRVFMDMYGLTMCFSLLTIFTVVNIICIYVFLPETKGKTEAEIRQILGK